MIPFAGICGRMRLNNIMPCIAEIFDFLKRQRMHLNFEVKMESVRRRIFPF